MWGVLSRTCALQSRAPAVGRHMPEPVALQTLSNCLTVRCHCSFDEFLEQMKRRGKPGRQTLPVTHSCLPWTLLTLAVSLTGDMLRACRCLLPRDDGHGAES